MKKAEEILSTKPAIVTGDINSKLTKHYEWNDVIDAMKENAIAFAKWHDKTDALRNKPELWETLYRSYINGHLF